VLLLNGVSHEFLHTFAGHEDTVDHVYHNHGDNQFAFEKQHHHCAFLDLQTPVFITSSLHFYVKNTLVQYNYFVLQQQVVFSSKAIYTALRGPPQLFV
jgi:hypothetical protein